MGFIVGMPLHLDNSRPFAQVALATRYVRNSLVVVQEP